RARGGMVGGPGPAHGRGARAPAQRPGLARRPGPPARRRRSRARRRTRRLRLVARRPCRLARGGPPLTAARGRPAGVGVTVAPSAPTALGGLLTFKRLEILSFCHSAIYLSLLTVWLIPGLHGAEMVLGWCHGIGWIVMSILALIAQRAGVISFRLAVLVAGLRRSRPLPRRPGGARVAPPPP